MDNPNGMQYDDQGRPFFLLANGQKSYVSPSAMGVDGTESGLGQNETGWHSSGQWNQDTGQVENPFKWGKLLSTVVAGGLGAGALSAAGAFGGLGAGGSGAATTAGEGAITPTLAGGTTLASSAVPGAGLIGAVPGAGATSGMITAGGSLVGSTTGGGALSQLGSLATREGLNRAGQVVGSLGKTAASNRGTALAASQNQDQINTQRGGEDRASEGDAWKRLQYASYVLNKKHGYQPSNPNLPHFGTDTPFDPTLAAGAQGLHDAAQTRLTNGSQLPALTNARAMSKPSAWERIMNVAGPALSLYGAR